MPTYRITAPNGKTYNVTAPEGTTPEQALAKVRGQYSAPTSKPMTQDEYGTAKAANLAGLGFGVGDEVLAGLGSVFRSDMGDYNKQLGYIRNSQNKLWQEDPAASLTSGILGGIPTALATGGGATALTARALPNAGRVGQAMATGAGYGGVAGFGSGEGGVQNRALSAVGGAAAGAAVGGAIEGVASPLIQSFVRWARGNPAMVNPQTGQPTPAFNRAAQEAGFDPQTASAELNKEFATLARNAANPAQAASMAEARTLPVPLRMSQGQATLDPAQQMLESQMLKGEFGPGAQQVVRNVADEQQAGMAANLQAIQARIGGGTANVAEAKQGVTALQQRLAEMQQTAQANKSGFYRAAEGAGREATVSARNVRSAGEEAMAVLRQEGFDQFSSPNTVRILEDVSIRGGRTTLNVSDVFRSIKRLTALQKGVPTPDSAAAGVAKARIQQWLDDAITNDLIQGDTQAVNAWRQANAGNRLYMGTFKSGDIVSKLVERSRDGQNALKLDVNGAANLLFGASKTGFVNKSGMARDIVKIRDLLGPTSPEWRALKEEAFMRFANAGQGAQTPTGTQFSGGNFMKAFEGAMRDSPEVMRSLFTRDELNLIAQFGRVARRLTTPVEGGKNFSNSGASITSMAKQLLMSTFMGPKLTAFLQGTPVLQGIMNLGQDIRANTAMTATLQRGFQPVPEVGRVVSQAVAPAAMLPPQYANRPQRQ